MASNSPHPPVGLQTMMTYEFGHVVGLDEGEIENSVMWVGQSRNSVRTRTLTADDRAGATAAYAADTGASIAEAIGSA